MDRKHQKDLNQLLVCRTFFKSQTVLLSIGSARPRRDLIILCENANLFVRQFLPACIVKPRLHSQWATNAVTTRVGATARAGVDACSLYDDRFKLFRNVLAAFDSD